MLRCRERGPHHAVSSVCMDTTPPAGPRHRDRRGRGIRGPLAWPPVPAMRARSAQFDDAVLDAMERIERRLGGPVENLQVAVELVPPSDPNPWEEQRVPLTRYFPAEPGLPGKIVLYRRPIETGLDDPLDLPVVVHDLIVEQVATALGVEPRFIDPDHPEY